VTSRELGISKPIAGVNMRLNAGGVRELHWHKAAEWSYMLYGTARITAIDAHGRNLVDDVGAGDLWYSTPTAANSFWSLTTRRDRGVPKDGNWPKARQVLHDHCHDNRAALATASGPPCEGNSRAASRNARLAPKSSVTVAPE
jgi:Cupin